jgi:hypothetical protein
MVGRDLKNILDIHKVSFKTKNVFKGRSRNILLNTRSLLDRHKLKESSNH